MAVSHTNCTHPRTPAGRRACRAESSKMSYSQSAAIIDDLRTSGVMEKPVRIQPRRSGGRVIPTGSTCVQAALHVDAHGGRCACGWEAS